MSTDTFDDHDQSSDRDVSDLSDDELLRKIARLDDRKYNLPARVREVLAQEESA